MLLALGGTLAIGRGAANAGQKLALVVFAATLVGLPLRVLSSGLNLEPTTSCRSFRLLMVTALIARPVDRSIRVGRVHALLSHSRSWLRTGRRCTGTSGGT